MSILHASILIPFVAIWTIASCSISVENIGISNLRPLNDNNEWIYQQTTILTGRLDTFIVRLGASRQFTLNNEVIDTWAEYSRSANSNQDEDLKVLYTNRIDGLYFVGAFGSTDSIFHLSNYLKHPVNPGQNWTTSRFFSDGVTLQFQDGITVTCTARDKPITVPAGAFECYEFHMRYRPDPDVLESWDVYLDYSAGIGLVQSTIASSLDGSEKWKSQLLSYHLN